MAPAAAVGTGGVKAGSCCARLEHCSRDSQLLAPSRPRNQRQRPCSVRVSASGRRGSSLEKHRAGIPWPLPGWNEASDGGEGRLPMPFGLDNSPFSTTGPKQLWSLVDQFVGSSASFPLVFGETLLKSFRRYVAHDGCISNLVPI